MKQLFALLLTLTICSAALAQTPSQINGAPVVVDVTGVVQSSPIDVFNYSLFPGSSTRYNTTSTISPAINYLDNGNLVVQCGSGTWTGVLPAIQALGTPLAITAGAYQQILYAPLTASISGSLVTCSGTGSITATTSTINGNPGSTSYPIPLGGSFFIFTDTSVPPAGNYVIVPLNSVAAAGATLGANTFTATQTISANGPNILLQDTNGSIGSNGGWWNIYSPAGSGNLCLSAIVDALTTNHNIICGDRTSDSTAAQSVVTLGNSTDQQNIEMFGVPTTGGTVIAVTCVTNCSGSIASAVGGAPRTAFSTFTFTGTSSQTMTVQLACPAGAGATHECQCGGSDTTDAQVLIQVGQTSSTCNLRSGLNPSTAGHWTVWIAGL